jgi:hypothetical protein
MTTPWTGSCTDTQQLVDLTTVNIPYCTGIPGYTGEKGVEKIDR